MIFTSVRLLLQWITHVYGIPLSIIGKKRQPFYSAVKFSGFSVFARGVPCLHPSWIPQLLTMNIDSLQPGYGWPPSGSPPCRSDLFRGLPVYRIGPRQPQQVIK